MKKLPVQLIAPGVQPQKSFVGSLHRKYALVANNQTITTENREKIWQDIFTAHNESSRSYHNLSHLYSITEILDQFAEPNADRSVLYWTTFFHDYIYKSTRKDNETKSADFARKVLTPILSSNQLDHICTIIESTARHEPLIDIPEQYAFLDADLAVLATDEDLYDLYSQAIRREYRIYPDLLYRPGRRKVLTHFLERKDIYYTSTFKKYELQARTNLNRELDQLS